MQRSIPNLYNDEEDLGRLDFQPTSRDHLFGRYFYITQFLTGEGGGENGQIANGAFVNVPYTGHSVGADWTHTFSAQWVDQLRYSFQQAKGFFQGGSYPNCLVTQIGSCPAQLVFQGGNDDVGFGENAAFSSGQNGEGYPGPEQRYLDEGKHTILFGGELDYQNAPDFGLFYYNSNLNYQTFNDFLQEGSSGDAYGLIADGPAVLPLPRSTLQAMFRMTGR